MPPAAPRRFGRSVLAVVAGLAVGILPAVGTDFLMHSTGIFPPVGQPMDDGLFVLAAGYRTAYGLASSYVVARLAPHHPMAHALWLGAFGMFVSLIGAVVTWNAAPAFGPHWYPLSLVVLALPTAWVGARVGTAART
jgi:hypothetical protein